MAAEGDNRRLHEKERYDEREYAMQVTGDNVIWRSSNHMERSRKRRHATTGMDEEEEDSMCRGNQL